MKTTTMSFIFAIWLTSFQALPLWAGAGSSNGGGVVVAGGRTQFLDLVKEATEVVYDPEGTKAHETLTKIMDSQDAFSTATILQQNFGISKSVKDRILEALAQLKFVMVLDELPLLNDAGLVILKWKFDGEVKRLAIQDRFTKTVLVDKRLFLRLLEEDKIEEKPIAAFFQHEALIRVYFDGKFQQLESTERIGNIVNITFGDDSLVKKFTPKSLAISLTRADIFTTHQQVQGLMPMVLRNVEDIRQANYSDVYVFFIDEGLVVHLRSDSAEDHQKTYLWNRNNWKFLALDGPEAEGHFSLLGPESMFFGIFYAPKQGSSKAASYYYRSIETGSIQSSFTLWKKNL